MLRTCILLSMWPGLQMNELMQSEHKKNWWLFCVVKRFWSLWSLFLADQISVATQPSVWVFAQAECRYPQSTDESWMGERPEWPFPVVAGDFGAQLWGPNSWMIGILLASETVGPKNAKQVPRWVGWQGKNRLPPFWQLEEPGFTPSTSKMEWSSFTSHHPFESQKPGCFFFF